MTPRTFIFISSPSHLGRPPHPILVASQLADIMVTGMHAHLLTTESRTLNIPFPDARLSTIALKAIGVDKELSPLVQRDLRTVAPGDGASKEDSVLQIEYKATTNRMLRVAVNSFMDSLSLVLEVMEEMDVDVLEPASVS